MRHDAYSDWVPWQVIFHESVVDWLQHLQSRERLRVMSAVSKLEELGPSLGRPLVDTIKGSSIKNLKELRPLSSNYRCLFAFDPKRVAILLIAGDKSTNWTGWYQSAIPMAENRFRAHLRKESD